MPSAITALRANFNRIRTAIPTSETALRADFLLRNSVLNAVLQATEEGAEVTTEIISRRVKALERIAEGIARTHQSGVAFEASQAEHINKAVKAWLMATQMFIPRGFEDAEVTYYATLAVPSGLSLTIDNNNSNASANVLAPSSLKRDTTATASTSSQGATSGTGGTAKSNNNSNASANAPAPRSDSKDSNTTKDSVQSTSSQGSLSSRVLSWLPW